MSIKLIKVYILILSCSLIFADLSEGLTLLTNLGGADGIQFKTRLINNNLEEINVWNHSSPPYCIGYLSPDSILTIGYKANQSDQIDSRIVRMNWNGDIIWDAIISLDIVQPHHDIEPLPNGNILLLGWETKTIEEATQAGKIDATDTFKPDKIAEIQPIGINDFEIIWKWYAWDHLIQEVNPNLDNYGNISNNPQLADINLIEIGPGEGDWMHTNAISYNESLDQIVLSVRHLCELWVIDHSTTTEEAASHSGGNSGKGGDIIYRWGNPENYGRGDSSDQILNAQHGVVWIPNSYPGGGNILLFNNRHNTGNSAVLEIVSPIDSLDNYTIDDGTFLPETYDWIHQDDFYSLNQSGAFRLQNGNTLITISSGSIIIEINNDGEILWEYDYNDGGFIPRAMKYETDYFNSFLLGDVNEDTIVDILDIILLVNSIISNEYNELLDLNSDENVDILDVVQLVNIILN